MALAPFRRERAVKEILLVKALPLRVVLLYRTGEGIARFFMKSLCKVGGMCPAGTGLFLPPRERVNGSAVPAAVTQEARLTPIPGWGEMLPGGSRGIAAFQRQGQKGVQDTPKDVVSTVAH